MTTDEDYYDDYEDFRIPKHHRHQNLAIAAWILGLIVIAAGIASYVTLFVL